MSHLITAHGQAEEPIASLEMGMAGPGRLARAGFDLYGLYGAHHLNGGVCGKGEGIEVDVDTAWNAYERALAWARRVWQGGKGSTTGKYCLVRADEIINFTLAVFRAAEREKVVVRFA